MAASRHRGYVFTIHANEEQEDTWPVADECPLELHDAVKYLVCQVERAPTTGKLHLQGFLYLNHPRTMSSVERILGGHAHIEVMHGTVEENELYCQKEESRVRGPWTLGEKPPGHGKRTDWVSVRDLIKKGTSDAELYDQFPHMANCCRGVDKLRQCLSPPVAYVRDVRVIVLWGAPGTGKSHRARTTYPDAYCITGKYSDGKSFDQYNGEKVLILDEFRDLEWPGTTVNALLDKWKLSLTCRYNNKYALWDTVIIISNQNPATMFMEDAAFQRRINGRTVHIVDRDNPEINLMTF